MAGSKYVDHELACTATSGNHSTPACSLLSSLRKASAPVEKCLLLSRAAASSGLIPRGRRFGSATEMLKESSRAGLAKSSLPSRARLVVPKLPSLKLSVRVRIPAVIWADPARMVKAEPSCFVGLEARSPSRAWKVAAQQRQSIAASRSGPDSGSIDAR